MSVLKYKQNNSWSEVPMFSVIGRDVPIGTICSYAGSSAPEGYMICDGSSLLRTEYSDLFNVISTNYGAVDNTHFNLPNIKGKTPIGLDSNDTDFNVIGKTAGTKSHAHILSIGQAAWYGMPMLETSDGIYIKDENGNRSVVSTGIKVPSTSRKRNAALSASMTTFTHDGFGVETTGNTYSSNNIPPYITVNYIIKVKQTAGIIGNVVDNLTSTSMIDALSANQGRVLNNKIDGISNIKVAILALSKHGEGQVNIDYSSINGTILSSFLVGGINTSDNVRVNLQPIIAGIGTQYSRLKGVYVHENYGGNSDTYFNVAVLYTEITN